MMMIEKNTKSLNVNDASYLHGTMINNFSNIVDPRVERTKRHKLLDIIFIAIAAAVCGGGDYVLALKGNHRLTHDEVENYFIQALTIDFEGVEYDCFVSLEKDHGRIEKRTVYVTADLDWLPSKDQWAHLISIILVVSERTIKGKTV